MIKPVAFLLPILPARRAEVVLALAGIREDVRVFDRFDQVDAQIALPEGGLLVRILRANSESESFRRRMTSMSRSA